MHLQKLNLSKLQKTNLSDVGSAYYCSPSFFQTWSRKLAINTLRSRALIFSNSLGSFPETKNFFNKETSLCVLLNVFLFFWCCTNSSKETQTCYSFPSCPPFSEEKFGGAAKKPPNLELSHLNENNEKL